MMGSKSWITTFPLWWLWTFFLAIIFSFIYWIHYSFTGDGPSLDEELSRSMAQIELDRKKAATAAPDGKEISPEEMLAQGKLTFNTNCAACHMENGAGSVGPNLTDAYWIHGDTPEDFRKVIEEGVLDKGMPPWKAILRPHQIDALLAYLETFRNKNVPGGKGPQGEKVN
jgi:cytochrome c oxidase cbb3-type subunit 3